MFKNKEEEDAETISRQLPAITSLCNVTNQLAIPEKKLKCVDAAPLAVCLERSLMATLLTESEASTANEEAVAIFRYSEKETSSASATSSASGEEKSQQQEQKPSEFKFEVVHLLEKKKTEFFRLLFVTKKNDFCRLFGIGENDEGENLLYFDLPSLHKNVSENEDEESKKCELKEVNLTLKNEEKLFDASYCAGLSNDQSILWVSSMSGPSSESCANGLFFLDTVTLERIAFLDFDENLQEEPQACESCCFAPHDDNIFAFSQGPLVSVGKIVKKDDVVLLHTFSSDKERHLENCLVMWPRRGKLIFGCLNMLYVADPEQKKIVQTISLLGEKSPSVGARGFRHGFLDCPLALPSRKSEIIVFTQQLWRSLDYSFVFLDVSGRRRNERKEAESSNNNESYDGQAQVVHRIRTSSGTEDKIYFRPTCGFAFLRPTTIISNGNAKLRSDEETTTEPLSYLFHVPDFAFQHRKKGFWIRDKGNAEKSAIVQVLREIYVVLYHVCMFL